MGSGDSASEPLSGVHDSPAVTTGVPTEHTLEPIEIEVIEIEGGMFYETSAVAMPVHCEGEIEHNHPDSGGDAADDSPEDAAEDEAEDDTDDEAEGGGDDDDETTFLTLYESLALVFRQLQIDSRKKVLIAGHSEPADPPSRGFELSEKRAKSILYLLTGEGAPWIELVTQNHLIIDYQQILKYFDNSRGWNCNPRNIDNGWTDRTARAVRRFFSRYNRRFARRRGLDQLPDDLYDTVANDPDKRWPEEAWAAVFNLYQDELRRVLEVTPTQMDTMRSTLLEFIAETTRYVRCGESFPINSEFSENYRSEDNHRVEILFFDPDEIPEMNCPDSTGEAHTEEVCPLWCSGNFTLSFVDPADLEIIPYHLKITYFNRIKNELLPVPEGLGITALANRRNDLNVRLDYRDGVYIVKVPEGRRRHIDFVFETTNRWIYTENADTDPQIVERTQVQINALTPLERQKYYDLPGKWSSRNYWTRYQNEGSEQGNRFQTVINNRLHLKPYGSEVTKIEEPLTFSLDDIVIVGANRSQNIRDKNQNGANRNLGANSRYTLFHIDYDTMETVGTESKNLRRMKIYNPDTNEPIFTDGALTTNLIHDVPGHARMISFCNGFYDIYDKRSSDRDRSFNRRRHVLGARLALLEDESVHAQKAITAQTASDVTNVYAHPSTGNFELHYFHNCAELDDKMLSYLLIYWSTRFTQTALNESGVTTAAGSDADVTNHRQHGMVNAMNRLNKDYLIEKDVAASDSDIYIRPFHFMEAKNDTRGGRHKAATNIIANTNSAGGDPGAWMSYTSAQLRARDYQGDPAYFGPADPINSIQDTDGATYEVQTNSHEMGHATGNWDEYLYSLQTTEPNPSGSGNITFVWQRLPRYNQPFTAEGGPYSCDELSRMYHNRTPRLRNFWRFVNWLHDAAGTDGNLNSFFADARFKIIFNGSNISHIHNFKLTDAQKNVQTPAIEGRNHALATDIEHDMLIYKLGDDELSHLLHSGQKFKGILVIKTKLAFTFTNGSTTDVWTLDSKREWVQGLNDAWKTMLNKKFRIATGNSDDYSTYDNLYVHFVPHFVTYSGTAPTDSHFNIDVTFTLGSGFTTSGNDIDSDWGTSTSARSAQWEKIIRYCFGKTTGSGNLAKTDLTGIKDWVQSEQGDSTHTYVIHDL